jgi:SAM-dependent methyltransferase
MRYDPIKDRLRAVVKKRPRLRRLFYRSLDLLFLRAWYVHRAVREYFGSRTARSSHDPVQVLDAGCGFGQYTYYIARRYPRALITAVDVKEAYLATAGLFSRRRASATGYSLCGRISQLPMSFPCSSLNSSISSSVSM